MQFFSKLHNSPDATLNMFVHIPKTAGTSFRASLEKSESVVCDYGKGKEHTSPVVADYIYEKNDIYGLKEQISCGKTWLCGHMHLNKYIGIVAPQNIVTFVREPLARVVSHYNHELRWGKNTDITLKEFLQSNRAKNSQQRFLEGLPLSLVGFVGITEQYPESLSLLHNEMSLKIEEVKFNENTQKASNIDDFDPALLSLIREQNALDQQLYELAKSIQKERARLAREKLPWTYVHAELSNNKKLQGVAYKRQNQDAVELELEVNNKVIATFKANELTALFPEVRFPRDRFVGFSYHFTQELEESDVVKIRARDTEQEYLISF